MATPVSMPAVLSPLRLRLVTFLVTGALFMEILDGTIITTALPAMARAFGTTAVNLNVGVSAYLLALGVFIPASGWMAERFGARRIFAAAIALFTLVSALCGSVGSLGAFVALRVVQGVAGAMMVPVGRLVVMRYTPKERLMATMSALVWPALMAPIVGPAVGGFIVTHASWRWIFYLNVPLGLAGLAAACVLLPRVREETVRPFDLPGFALGGLGIFALLWGLDRAAVRIDAIGTGLLAAGLCVLALAVRHLGRTATPMLSLRAYAIPTFRTAMRGGAVSRMAIASQPFLLPLLFQVGFGLDAFHSGLLVLTVFVGDVAMKLFTNRILRQVGYRPVLVWNGLLCALTLAACACLRPGLPLAATILILVASGMARSMQFTAISTLAFADVPKERITDANGLFNTVNQVCMGAGITLGALAVRMGHLAVERFGLRVPGGEYRIAFALVAVLALASVIDALQLPRGAGDHFVSR